MAEILPADVDWTTYDGMAGPQLSAHHWEPLRFGARACLEPDARTTVHDGVCTIEVPEFTFGHDLSQGADDCKHVWISRRAFRVPPFGAGVFAVDLRAEVIAEPSGDYRQGFAAFVVIDTTGTTNLVANVLCTGDRYMVEHEVLPGLEDVEEFARIVEDPFFFSRGRARLGDDQFRQCCIEIDRSRGRITWSIDGRIIYKSTDITSLPDEVHIALGIFTAVPLGGAVGSCHGQGVRASWRNVRYSLIDQR